MYTEPPFSSHSNGIFPPDKIVRQFSRKEQDAMAGYPALCESIKNVVRGLTTRLILGLKDHPPLEVQLEDQIQTCTRASTKSAF
ncbi:hypothetical protein GC093_22005 [Paenibacillus sp. LMG 31456]|uniref:Uncharacterized protein n=1 Tax=Paenibacillus foliorum TaxID=2654974 RepID=A0A972GS60_9BACL|nr:hypothetical protein [Paenibacillus foliorum]NOU95876.1 hypothetical protein [Paenibacillus foliorum]